MLSSDVSLSPEQQKLIEPAAKSAQELIDMVKEKSLNQEIKSCSFVLLNLLTS